MSILRTPTVLSQHRQRSGGDTASRRIHRSPRPSLRWGRSYFAASALAAVMALGWLGTANATAAPGGHSTTQQASAISGLLTMHPACAGMPLPCK